MHVGAVKARQLDEVPRIEDITGSIYLAARGGTMGSGAGSQYVILVRRPSHEDIHIRKRFH